MGALWAKRSHLRSVGKVVAAAFIALPLLTLASFRHLRWRWSL